MKPSLVRQHTLWLASAFIALELLLAALFLGLLALPMARRAADDLAGLMVLSAQTWAELSPAARPAFARELQASHGLELAAPLIYQNQVEWHPPMIDLLEQALVRRIGQPVHLYHESHGGQSRYSINLPAGSSSIAVSVLQDRYDSRPLVVLGVGLLGSLLAACAMAVWLARRIVAPLTRLDQAMSVVSAGGTPLALPETGPSELAALSRHFNIMAHQVRALLSARTTLLAGVSHDLRTPLARMRLALEIMRATPLPQYLDRIERDIEQMDRLIGQTLDLARGLEKEPRQAIAIQPFLQQLVAEFETEATPIRLAAADGQLQAPVIALKRAIGNLLQNAQRYAAGQPVELACLTAAASWRIGVLDRGPGIPASQIELMTTPFQRMEVSRSVVTGGSGLGLAIVKELAKANGWQLEISNRAGGGLQAWLVQGDEAA